MTQWPERAGVHQTGPSPHLAESSAVTWASAQVTALHTTDTTRGPVPACVEIAAPP